jgi:predicted GIY-YIG superfamily endonuclease
MAKPGYVYLIQLDQAIAHARFYVGSTWNLKERLQVHLSDRGSPLLTSANQQGIHWHYAAIVECPDIGTARQLEAKIKRWKKNRLLLSRATLGEYLVYRFGGE